MQWLPTSSEGKQLYGLGLGSLVAIIAGVAGMFALISVRLVFTESEVALRNEAALVASVTPATSGALPATADGQHLHVWRVGADGRVASSSLPAMVGKTSDEAQALLQDVWQNPMTASAPVGGDTLTLGAPRPPVGPVLAQIGTGFAVSLFLIVLAIPFLKRLGTSWVTPVELFYEGDRDDKPLPITIFPSGMLRELVTRRNQRMEILRAKEGALSRRSAQMEVLYDLSREMGLSRDAPDVPNLALTSLSKAVDYDIGALLLITEDRPVLRLRSRGPVRDGVKAETEVAAVNAFFERAGILLDNDRLEVTDGAVDPRGPLLEGTIRAAQWVPLVVNGRTVGVMGVLSLSDRGAMSAESLRTLNIIAQNVALALEKLHVQRLEETQRFRNVLENLVEGVVLVRQTGEWALATGTARAFHQAICGSEVQATVEHARQCPIGLLGLDVFHSGTGITREITRDERTFILVGTFVRASAAGEQGTVISIRDVTEERATQQKLFQASKLASLGELAAGVAHEVNNPLTGILGFTELTLSRSDLTPPVVESLQEIHALARRTNQITMDLLLFARVQREGGFRAVSLRAVVKDTIKLLETSYRNLSLELVTDLGPEDDRLLAYGDQGKIQQIVTNLAQNAKDAITMSGKGRSIRFHGYRQKGEVVLEVRDDGPGIPDRIRSKILEPFFTTKPIGKGTGLGLAIVNRIIEEHKGRLVIDSEEGLGTTFRISLPEAPADAEEAPPLTPPSPPMMRAEVKDPPPSPPPLAGGDAAAPTRGTVVVLDDEVTVLKFLTRSLQSEGLRVHTTSDPDEAVALIETHRPDLLFLDFRMPEITGEEFYARMVAIDPRWADRIVFLSGDVSGDEIQTFLRTTGAPALHKPVGIADLRAFVEKKLLALRSGVGSV